MIRQLSLLLLVSGCMSQYAVQRNNPQENIPAWYQMSKTAAAPTYTYDRRDPFEHRPQPQHSNSYNNYGSYGSRSSYPDPQMPQMPMTGSAPMPMPTPQLPRRYPGGQDMPYSSSVRRYHKLLLRTSRRPRTTTSTTFPTPTETTTKLLPKSLGSIYSTIVPKGINDRKLVKWRKLTPVPSQKITLPTSTTTKPISTSTTTVTTPSTQRTDAPPPRFICSKIIQEVIASTQRTIPPFRPVDRTFKPWRRIETTTTPVVTTEAPSSLFQLLWPNSELIAAIKDVVAKFKASLDETGLDQDVRLMGNQLKNTWQQLRTGVDRGMKAVKQSAEMSIRDMNYGPMNEQLGRILDKAAADSADPVEKKLRRD